MRGRLSINICLTSIFFFLSFIIVAQLKPPVAETDHASAFVSNPVVINVLANDYSYAGDTLVIYGITSVVNGQAYFEDSLIYFTPLGSGSLLHSGKVYYIIKDLTTGLWSEEGEVIITYKRVKNKIFTPNKLSVRINAIGNQFMAIDSFSFDAPNHYFEAPVNSGKHTINNSALWVAGLDDQGELHTACERNRKGKYPFVSHKGWDFWVGPVMDTAYYTSEYLTAYNTLWYITREDISYHNNNYQHSNYLMSQRIKNWPANGFPEMGTAEILAPFNDINQNGYYDPENGDYPLIRGDEAIYFIFNDDFGKHTESFGKKMGIEVHGLAYGFNCEEDSAFHNTLFIRYEVINRSDTSYHDVYLGNYTNLVIGSPDDYLVCDTLLNAFYAYNSDDFDDTLSVYYPGYMEHPPAQAVVHLNQPIDHFMYCRYPWPFYDTLFNLSPRYTHQYYNFMKSVWNDSTHLTYGGDGHLGVTEVNHALTGDPLTGYGWTEENSGMENPHLFGIASRGPLLFDPGDTLTIELAYVFARDYEGDHLSSVSLLKERSDRVLWFYDNDSTPCGTPWSGSAEYSKVAKRFKVVPNPATSYIKLNYTFPDGRTDYEIYRVTGQLIKKGNLYKGKKIDIIDLPTGCYFIRIYNLEDVLSAKFIILK